MDSFPSGVCVCVCVRVCLWKQAFSRRHSATSSEREGAKKCGGVRAATGSEREGAKMCGGGRAGGIPLLIFRRRGRFQQWTTANYSPPLAPLFAVSLLKLSYTVLNYLAKPRNIWSQSGIVVNTTAGPRRI